MPGTGALHDSIGIGKRLFTLLLQPDEGRIQDYDHLVILVCLRSQKINLMAS